MIKISSEHRFDVIIIGGGVVGCAVLRELSRFQIRVLLLEKEADLAEGISKANSGVIHAGFNVPTGTLKAKTNVRGLFKIYELARQLNVPHKKTGKLVVALNDADKERLQDLKAQGERNKTPDLSIIGADLIQKYEPLAAGRRALFSPHTGIISPYQFTIAQAECALQNDARILLEAPVTNVQHNSGHFILQTPKGEFETSWVVNSAGLFADEIARLAGIDIYKIFPYRGEYHITDKDLKFNLQMPIYPVPPKDGAGLGVHITPSIDGNILIGPSAANIQEKNDTASTKIVMEQLKKEAFDLMPQLKQLQFIHSFAGVRPKLVDPQGNEKFKDFVIEESEICPRWINLIGIESPGLTSSPAIAEMIVDIIGNKFDLMPKEDYNPERPAVVRFAELDDETRERLVREDPNWGEMVCRCETVTRAEVIHALNNPLGVRTLDGIKRRTRCGMGRCQGGFCTPRIMEILQSQGFTPDRISKRGADSFLFAGKLK